MQVAARRHFLSLLYEIGVSRRSIRSIVQNERCITPNRATLKDAMSTPSSTIKVPPILTDIEYYILLTILSTPRHGIGIFEDVARLTDNQLVLSPGTLYAALKRMFASGWVTMVEPSEAGYAPDERRKIYLATEEGVQVVEEKAAWFELETGRARTVLARRAEREAADWPDTSESPHDEPQQGGSRNTSRKSRGDSGNEGSSRRSTKKP